VLLSWHNVAYYQFLMQRLRGAIAEGQLSRFVAEFKAAGERA
jgi:queuine tRNA-ribosyltransferase